MVATYKITWRHNPEDMSTNKQLFSPKLPNYNRECITEMGACSSAEKSGFQTILELLVQIHPHSNLPIRLNSSEESKYIKLSKNYCSCKHLQFVTVIKKAGHGPL
jgi:hypothetical protein